MTTPTPIHLCATFGAYCLDPGRAIPIDIDSDIVFRTQTFFSPEKGVEYKQFHTLDEAIKYVWDLRTQWKSFHSRVLVVDLTSSRNEAALLTLDKHVYEPDLEVTFVVKPRIVDVPEWQTRGLS